MTPPHVRCLRRSYFERAQEMFVVDDFEKSAALYERAISVESTAEGHARARSFYAHLPVRVTTFHSANFAPIF